MTNKHINWGSYSAKRLRQRGMTRQQVRHILAVGIRSEELTLHGAQRYSRRAYVGTREAKVVFVEGRTSISIITVMWVGDKPGDWPAV